MSTIDELIEHMKELRARLDINRPGVVATSIEEEIDKLIKETIRIQRGLRRKRIMIGTALFIGIFLLGALIPFIIFPIPLPPYPTFDFEESDQGWSEVMAQEIYLETESVIDEFPLNISAELSSDFALTGQQSLKVTSLAHKSGGHKHFLYFRPDTPFKAYGALLYVYVPETTANTTLAYIQICSTLETWACNDGVIPEQGAWTPLLLDLSQDVEETPLYKTPLEELAIQWVFKTEESSEFDLYFDSGELITESN